MVFVQRADISVTVFMAVYNGEKYVIPAVDSILAQSIQDFEFLIIDDGSSDRSPEYLRRFAALDKRIRLIQRENRGLVATLNEGLAEARGKWILRLDHDDIAYPENLEHHLQFIAGHPKCVVVGGAFDYIDEKGRYLTTIYQPEDNETIQELMLRGHNALCDSTLVFHRELALRLGGYRPEMALAEDMDLWLRMGEHGDLANMPHVVSQYRLHTASLSGSAHAQQREVMRRVCEEAWERRGIVGTFEAEDSWRPALDSCSRSRFSLMYGWWAFNSGQRRTAALYGCRAIAACPLKFGGYKLLACALFKCGKPSRITGTWGNPSGRDRDAT